MPTTTFEKLLKRCEYDPAKYQDHSDWFIAWMKLKEFLQIDAIDKKNILLGFGRGDNHAPLSSGSGKRESIKRTPSQGD